MKRVLFLYLAGLLHTTFLFSQDFELFHQTEHFTFYRQDTREYDRYIQAFSDFYPELVEILHIEKGHSINVYIFPGQRDFIEKIYGYYEQKVTSVGMAKRGEDTIYITSYHDQGTGRGLDEYCKVARHELVHTLLSCDKAWLDEGLALYLAGQERDFISYPENREEILFYVQSNIYNKEAYAYYSWLTRYIIEENGFEAFLEFFKSNDDWNIIGYRDKHDFCAQAYTALTASFDTRQ